MIVSGIWCPNVVCPASIWSLLWYWRIIPVPLRSQFPAVQLDWWEPLLHQRQQWEFEYRCRWWKIRPLVGWRFISGAFWKVPDLWEWSADAQCRFCRQNAGMLGVHIKHNILCFNSRVMIAADVICWWLFFITFL